MPFVNIKQSKLVPRIGKAVGRLEGELQGKIQKDISDSRTKFSSRCPDNAGLERVSKQKDQLNRAVGGFENRIRSFKRIPPPLRRISRTIRRIIRIIKKLPIPQGFPKPFGLPMSVDMKFADLLHKVKELSIQLGEDAETIDTILKSTEDSITAAKSALSSLDGPIQACTIANALGDENLSNRVPLLLNIDEDGNILTVDINGFPAIFDPSLLTGDIGVNGIPTVINNSDSSTVPSFINSETGEVVDVPTGVGAGGVGAGSVGAGGVGAGNIDIPAITAVASKENYKRIGLYNPDLIYFDNRNRKDTVFYEGTEYIVNNSSKDGRTGWDNPKNGKDWKRLNLEELKSTKDLIRCADGNLYTEEALRKNLSDIQNILDDLNKSSLDDNQLQAVEDLYNRLNLKDVEAPEGGIVPYRDYFLEVTEDPTDFGLAPRRFAIAKDEEGVIVLRGPSSFSSSTDILIQELKFRIDTQLP